MKVSESWLDDKKVREFKLNVTNEDYDTECCVHNGSFADLVKVICSREEHLNKLADTSTWPNKQTCDMRRDNEGNDDDQQEGKSSRRVTTDNSWDDNLLHTFHSFQTFCTSLWM